MNFDDWFAGASARIRGTVPCDSVTFAELHVNGQRSANATIDLPNFDSQPLVPAFVETYHEHPISPDLILDRTDSIVLVTSDFISQPALHNTDLYKRVFRVLEIEYQARLVMNVGANSIFGFGVNRRLKTFNNREHEKLRQLQDGLTYSYRELLIRENLRDATALVVNARGRIITANVRALDLLASFFEGFESASRLPQTVVDWLQYHLQFAAGLETELPTNPFVWRREDQSLLIYAMPAATPGQLVLALRVWHSLTRQAAIQRLIARSAIERKKLSGKEAEVLYWWSQGRSAKETASVIGMTAARGVLRATKSVEKAVERVYEKLELHERYAVAELVREWLRPTS